MNSILKNAIKYLLMLALGGFLFWYVLKDMDPGKVEADFRRADYFWITASVLISLIAYWVRALRWNLLLEPLGITPPAYKTAIALMSGYFVNILLPRGGEVARCVVLNKMHKAPFNSSFGSVVTERVFDLLGLLFLIGLTFIVQFDTISDFLSGILIDKFVGLFASLQSMYLFLCIGIVVLVAMFGMLWYLRHEIRKNATYQKTSVFLTGVWEGIIGIRRLQKKWLFLLYTLLIWISYYFMTYTVFFALPETSHLGFGVGLVILVVGGLGMSAPVQGGIGVFHIFVYSALLIYGINIDIGKSYAILVHTSQTLTVIVLGGISFIISLLIGKSEPAEEVSQS